jgi:hypothetical protein
VTSLGGNELVTLGRVESNPVRVDFLLHVRDHGELSVLHEMAAHHPAAVRIGDRSRATCLLGEQNVSLRGVLRPDGTYPLSPARSEGLAGWSSVIGERVSRPWHVMHDDSESVTRLLEDSVVVVERKRRQRIATASIRGKWVVGDSGDTQGPLGLTVVWFQCAGSRWANRPPDRRAISF